MKNPENRCNGHQDGAWIRTMRRELMSACTLVLLLATGAVAEELSPTPPVDEAREREKLARDLADLAQQARPPRGVPMPRGGQPCAPRAELVKGLNEKYGEHQIALGIQSNGILLEIYATIDGSTWSAVTTFAQTNLSCIVAAGMHWVQAPVTAAETGEPS